MAKDTMNIASWYKAPASTLSNLAHTPFQFVLTPDDLFAMRLTLETIHSSGVPNGIDVPCNSAEGLIQGMKCLVRGEQRELFLLSGKEAKSIGKKHPPKAFLSLLGIKTHYGSVRHRAIIEWCIRSKFAHSEVAQQAMLDTADRTYTHNLGRFDPKPGKTSLWKTSFVRILHSCRDVLMGRIPAPTFAQVFEAIEKDIYDEARFYPLPTRVI